MRASRLAVSLAVVTVLAASACTTGSGTSEPATSLSVEPTAQVSSTTVQGRTSTTSTSEPHRSTAEVPSGLPSLDLYDVSDLVKRVRSGVVSVTQERVRLDLFGVPEEVPAGAGSGIVIDGDGLVLANFHVIVWGGDPLVNSSQPPA